MGKLTVTRTERIHWGDCDPAGIIYYPRYFEMFDRCTTLMLEQAVGMTKHQYLTTYDFTGHPVVETRGRFLLPTKFGDDVVIETSIVSIGRTSFQVHHRLSKDKRLAVEGSETRVWVRRRSAESTSIKAHPIPDEVVALLGGR